MIFYSCALSKNLDKELSISSMESYVIILKKFRYLSSKVRHFTILQDSSNH